MKFLMQKLRGEFTAAAFGVLCFSVVEIHELRQLHAFQSPLFLISNYGSVRALKTPSVESLMMRLQLIFGEGQIDCRLEHTGHGYTGDG